MNYAVMEQVFLNSTFIATGVASLLFVLALTLKKDLLNKLGYMAMVAGFLASSGALLSRLMDSGHPPVSNFFESLIYVIWAMLGMYLVVAHRYKSLVFSVGAAPFVFIVMGISSILPQNWKASGPLVPALQSYWINIHVTLMLISYAAFALAAVTSIIYLVYSFTSKQQLVVSGSGSSHNISFETVMNNDSLEESNDANRHLVLFDEMTHRLILFGFPVLAIGIIMGALWANHAWGTYWSWDPKETSSLMTWLFYAAYIHFRHTGKATGRNAAFFSLVGFGAMIFTYYMVNYLPGLHSYAGMG